MYAALIFNTCDTKEVGSLGIQLPMTIRPPGPGDPDHLPGDLGGFRSKHGTEDREGQVEGMVGDSLQLARIALLELQPVETQRRRAFVAGFHEVPGNVDPDNFRAGLRKGNRRRPHLRSPRSKARNGGVMASDWTRALPDWRIKLPRSR